MSSGDCCVKANRSWEVTIALWDGRGMELAVHTHTHALRQHNHTSQRNQIHKRVNTRVKVKVHAQMLIICSYPAVPPTSTHKHGPPVSPCSLLILFVVSGLGLLLIPCGAFGCSVITRNRFHTLTAKGVCLRECMCVAVGVYTCQDQAGGGGGVCQRSVSASGMNLISNLTVTRLDHGTRRNPSRVRFWLGVYRNHQTCETCEELLESLTAEGVQKKIKEFKELAASSHLSF